MGGVGSTRRCVGFSGCPDDHVVAARELHVDVARLAQLLDGIDGATQGGGVGPALLHMLGPDADRYRIACGQTACPHIDDGFRAAKPMVALLPSMRRTCPLMKFIRGE